MTQNVRANGMWRKSSYSNQSGGNCVEVAVLVEAVAIRDSKDLRRGRLDVAPAAWDDLTARLKD